MFSKKVRILIWKWTKKLILFELLDGLILYYFFLNTKDVDITAIWAYEAKSMSTHVKLHSTNFIAPAKRLFYWVGTSCICTVITNMNSLSITTWL